MWRGAGGEGNMGWKPVAQNMTPAIHQGQVAAGNIGGEGHTTNTGKMPAERTSNRTRAGCPCHKI